MRFSSGRVFDTMDYGNLQAWGSHFPLIALCWAFFSLDGNEMALYFFLQATDQRYRVILSRNSLILFLYYFAACSFSFLSSTSGFSSLCRISPAHGFDLCTMWCWARYRTVRRVMAGWLVCSWEGKFDRSGGREITFYEYFNLLCLFKRRVVGEWRGKWWPGDGVYCFASALVEGSGRIGKMGKGNGRGVY